MVNPSRRNSLLALAALSLHEPVLANVSKPRKTPPTSWTIEQEQAAAKQAAQLISEQTGEAPHPAAGEMLRFKQALPLVDGHRWDESTARGHMLLVFYWASWCPICKALAPKLQSFWLSHRHQGLQILAVSADKDPHVSQTTAKKMGFKFPIIMEADLKLDPIFQSRSLPTLLVRSRRGVVVAIEEGDLSREELSELLVHL
jgi:peroxiredoxin